MGIRGAKVFPYLNPQCVVMLNIDHHRDFVGKRRRSHATV